MKYRDQDHSVSRRLWVNYKGHYLFFKIKEGTASLLRSCGHLSSFRCIEFSWLPMSILTENLEDRHINIKETVAAICLLIAVKEQTKGRATIILSDNITAVRIIRYRRVADSISLLENHWHAIIQASHIPGILLRGPDGSSRLGHPEPWNVSWSSSGKLSFRWVLIALGVKDSFSDQWQGTLVPLAKEAKKS